MTAPTVVLVHGAWHGAWCWQAVTPLLDGASVPHLEVELPFTGPDDDVEAVRAALDDIDGTKVLVGHSYGGLVISGAGEGRSDLVHLVYLCAFMVQPGETIFDELLRVPDIPSGKLLGAIVSHDDGTSSVDPGQAIAAFYALSPLKAAREAVHRLRPMHGQSTLSPCKGAPWKRIPSTYVLCEHDQAIPIEGQRAMASKASRSITLPADHSPFLSMPDETAQLIVALATVES